MSAPSPYAVAIEATRWALTERAVGYRNLVVVVVLIAFIAVALAMSLGHWWPLSITAALPAAVLTFAWRDAALLHRWRAGIMRAWGANELRLDVLVSTLRQVPGMPPSTLAGMLAALPAALEGEMVLAARGVAARAQEAVAAAANGWLLGCVGAAWLAAFVLVVAAATGLAVLVGALLVPPAVMLLGGALVWRGLRDELRAAAAALAEVEGTKPTWMASLDWQGVPLAMLRAVNRN